jgi:D-tyrosyl-tRNA(Tyr) deacylase
MRALLQRVSRASVKVDGELVGSIGPGLLALVCVGHEDGEAELELLARKTVQLRIFPDEQQKMNRSLLDVGGELLAVSQFTLYADCRKGRRPSFIGAAPPDKGEELFDLWCEKVRSYGVRVATGVFGAMMDVELVNDGPVTIWLDTAER